MQMQTITFSEVTQFQKDKSYVLLCTQYTEHQNCDAYAWNWLFEISSLFTDLVYTLEDQLVFLLYGCWIVYLVEG